MNSDDVNDRKQKLSNIIKKITESQLLKIKEADNRACNRQDCKFTMDPRECNNEMKKAMSIKLMNDKGHFGAPVGVGGFNSETAGSSTEKPVGPRVNL